MWQQTKEAIDKEVPTLERGAAYIDLDAIVSNMESMHAHMKPEIKMFAVIKTNGYGHGATPIASVLEKLDYVYGYAVATIEEALSLREAEIKKPILILGYTFPYGHADLALHDISQAVFREDDLQRLSQTALSLGKTISVHVKVDTGMGRIGISPDERGFAFVEKVIHTPGISLDGIFTHFAKADEFDKTHVNHQLTVFTDFVKSAENRFGIRIPIHHASNSAGILELPNAHLDMVRAGITLYGLMPSDEVQTGSVHLTPAMSLKSHISFIKDVYPGQSISYGGLFVAEHKMRVATVPMGYGDGYPRLLTGKGEVLISGKRCPILGRVCMDQFMVDVTNLPQVLEGDQVTLLGRDGEEEITADELGQLSGRFNYELVCLISNRIPRVFVKDGEIQAVIRYGCFGL